MSDHEARKETLAAGEPGTVAVTVDEAGAKPSYKPDLTGAAPKLRVQNLHVTYRNRQGAHRGGAGCLVRRRRPA